MLENRLASVRLLPDAESFSFGAGGIGGLLARTEHVTLTPIHAYYHADGNGNVTAMLDARQLLVAKYSYDPYGNVLSKAGPLVESNTYRFFFKGHSSKLGIVLLWISFLQPELSAVAK